MGQTADISDATLSLDSGLYIKIEVRPLNTALEDDEGSVNLNICEEEAGEIKPDSCIFIGSATVIAETNGLGNAEIVVQNFPDAGERILLFEYKHAKGAIDPTSVEHSVSIDKLQIYIFASEICDPLTLDNCIIGLEAGITPVIQFDLSIAENATYIPLPSIYPEPPTDEKFEFGSSVGGNDWTCNVETGTNGEYLLTGQ